MFRSADVAEFILQQCGSMSPMKLQKLVYYSQAWSLVWDGRPLFNDEIQAWANGPVAPELYREHRGQSLTATVGGDAGVVAADELASETILAVLEYYGAKSPQWLSDLSHSESPWRDARAGLAAGAWSNRAISQDAMRTYYSALA